MFTLEGTGRSRDSSSSGQLPTLELHDDSRVTTPSSPGSTSGESLSGLDDVSGNHSTDDLNSDVRASAGDAAASAALSSASTSSSAPPTAGHANGHHRHVHHATGQVNSSSSTASNTHQGGTAASGSGSSSLSSRRRHHHHQHTLTLGTGAAKMGSSITDSAQSTEDEMFDDEKEEELDTEDDRPRVLYPALATPKAIGNNFWPFGTSTNDMEQGDEQEDEEREGQGNHEHQHDEQEMYDDQAMASTNHYGPSSTQESSSSMTARNGSTGGHSHGHGQRARSPSEPAETALEVYRHQIHAPSGANAAFLPHEILLKILRNVRQTDDLVNALQVCKSWCQCGVELLWNKPLFPNVGPLIKMLVVLSRQTVTFPYASFIKRLNFSQLADKMSDALLSRLCVCTRLERLTLAGCAEITDDSMTTLLATSSKNLVALDLSDCVKITNDTVRTAAKFCKKLQGLNLSGCRLVTDDGVQAIAKGCPLLRRVKLRNLDTLTDDAIIALALACPLLLEVDLYACSSITDRTLWALFRNCSHLRELSLNNCTQVTGEGFPQRDGKLLYIKGRDDPSLIGLKPSNSKFNHIPSKVLEIYDNSTDPNLQNVTALASRMFDHVRYLDLTGMTNLTDMAMAGIVATMPHIRNLVLAKCSSLTDESVQSICKLGKHIHFLHLGHVSNITDKAVTTLARACTRLRYIDLACCPNLTDLSVFELAQNLPRLKRIGLVRVANLTDQAIFALAERTTLERIHLSYCEHVSVMAIQFLLIRLGRLNHLSLTGVPAFRRADLQHFCRPPPKDFNPHQRSTFCVYSGKGVHELRKHLMSLQQSELAGHTHGMTTLIPAHANAQAHALGNQPLHMQHAQFAQMQLGHGANAHLGHQLPTYPHLFQHNGGHAVIAQVPLNPQDGDDIDEDVDEDDEENGDDEADDDTAVPEQHHSSASRRTQHNSQQPHHRHYHTHQPHSSSSHRHQHGTSSASQARASYNDRQRTETESSGEYLTMNVSRAGTANRNTRSTFVPPPYYRGNHRMTGQDGSLLDISPGSESEYVTVGSSAPSALGGHTSTAPPPMPPFAQHAFYSTALPPLPSAASSRNQQQQSLQYASIGQQPTQGTDIRWMDQILRNEPITQIRFPPVHSQSSPPPGSSSGTGLGAGAAGTSNGTAEPLFTGLGLTARPPFTPTRSPAHVASNATSQMDTEQQRSSGGGEQRSRSHSIEMATSGETGDESMQDEDSPDGSSRRARQRRDTIMESNYRVSSP